MISSLRTRWHAFRHLGVRRGTATAIRHLLAIGAGRMRRWQLARRPITVGADDVAATLGERDPRAAFLAARDALPSVTAALASLNGADQATREQIISSADRILAHEFDLLGSGPVQLGAVIDWHQDFKSGRRWPLDHISQIVVSYPDHSDIKVPWELSRSQHLPLLALAHKLTGDRRYLDEIGAQMQDWIGANPVEFGVNWQCTMDAAIRAVNWTATLAICSAEPEAQPWLATAATALLLHARFIRSHLEHSSARGNHYLSDVVGLLVTAAVFRTSAEGQRWISWSTAELGRELRHQIRADGCDHEASTSYHRLVTELFIVGADAADALAPGALDPIVRPAIRRMLQFVADYTRPDGLAPQIGDADNGRLLPLGEYGSVDQRSHLHLFRQAAAEYRPARASAAYPEGGFYFMRSGQLYAAVRCGDVGIHGRGCHAHNDLLGFELSYGATPLVVDPGTYLYTADPAVRNHYRSTAVHATLQVDDREQNEIRSDRLFAMADRARPEVLAWKDGIVSELQGRHRGFVMPTDACLHTRTLRLDGGQASLEVTDELASELGHDLVWRFPLAPCDVEVQGDIVQARFRGMTLRISGEELVPDVAPGRLSPSYGVELVAPVVSLRGRSAPGAFRTVISLIVVAE